MAEHERSAKAECAVLLGRSASVENHLYESTSHREVHPAPCTFETSSAKRARVSGKLAGVLDGFGCPLGPRAR